VPNKRFLAATICFFRSEGVGDSGRSGITQFFLQEAFEPGFVFSRVFLPPIDDERGVTEGPVADGFKESLKGLSVGNPDHNSIPVLMGQFSYPSGEEEIVFLNFLRIIIEVLVIPLVLQLQTQLV
jgi:hypothetical protein